MQTKILGFAYVLILLFMSVDVAGLEGRMTLLGGTKDDFAQPPDPVEANPALSSFIDVCRDGAPLVFDEIPIDQSLAISFENLPSGIYAARLEFKARAGINILSETDYFALVEVEDLNIDDCSWKVPWLVRFVDLPESGGAWVDGQTAVFNVDFSALPTSIGVVNTLESLADGNLHLLFRDDSGYDYVELTIDLDTAILFSDDFESGDVRAWSSRFDLAPTPEH